MNPRHVPSVLRRHPALRWGVPVVVAGVAVLIASGVLSNAAPSSDELPHTTAAELLADVGSTQTGGFVGTVVSHVSLGLPDLPSVGDLQPSSPLTALMAGSQTLQVWYGGLERQRVAVLGTTGETDIFRSGRTVWRWDSADRVADRVRLAKPAASQSAPDGRPTVASSAAPSTDVATPDGLASFALAAIRPSTRVSVQPGSDVADRSTYDLVLQPRTASTRIGAVHIAVDGKTKVPLGVRVYPRGSSTAAIDVSFTSIHFGAPTPTTFDFTPPMGSTVRHLSLQRLRDEGELSPRRLSVSGRDWSSVVSYDVGHEVHTRGLGLGQAVTKVSGTWGSGRLLQTSLLSVLLTHSGRIYAGAVDPTALYAAAEHH